MYPAGLPEFVALEVLCPIPRPTFPSWIPKAEALAFASAFARRPPAFASNQRKVRHF